MINKDLKSIYNKIPSMQCKSGCSDCCGIAPIIKEEAEKLGVNGSLLPFDENMRCKYIGENGGCTIYEDRPFICRLFGTTLDPALICPHGCSPQVMLTKEQASNLFALYITGRNFVGIKNPS